MAELDRGEGSFRIFYSAVYSHTNAVAPKHPQTHAGTYTQSDKFQYTSIANKTPIIALNLWSEWAILFIYSFQAETILHIRSQPIFIRKKDAVLILLDGNNFCITINGNTRVLRESWDHEFAKIYDSLARNLIASIAIKSYTMVVCASVFPLKRLCARDYGSFHNIRSNPITRVSLKAW